MARRSVRDDAFRGETHAASFFFININNRDYYTRDTYCLRCRNEAHQLSYHLVTVQTLRPHEQRIAGAHCDLVIREIDSARHRRITTNIPVLMFFTL